MADNRGPWIIALAIVLAAGFGLGGFIWWQSRQDSCERWREDFRAAVEDAFGSGAATAEAFEPHTERIAEIGVERPEGCDQPSTQLDPYIDLDDLDE